LNVNGRFQGTSLHVQGRRIILTRYQHAVRKVQENQVRPKLNETHQPLVYADDVNLLGDNIDAIKKKHGNFN
jgi:hypothetical protein